MEQASCLPCQCGIRPHSPARCNYHTPPARETVSAPGCCTFRSEGSCNGSLGRVDPETVLKVEVQVSDQEKARQERLANRPPLTEILNLHDFEVRR